MRKAFFFFLFTILLQAQKAEAINLSTSVKSKKVNYKSFTVIDNRENKEIGSVMYHNDQVNMVFENDAEKDIKDWFYSDNPLRGNDELVLLIENIKLSEDKYEKYSLGKLEIRASTFLKKNDKYHFLYKKDTVTTVSSRVTPYLAQSLAKKLSITFSELLKGSYEAISWEIPVSREELPKYAFILKDRLEILKTEGLKDGVYKDFYSFFTHNPEPGFTIETNSKGIATKAIRGEEKKPIRNFYAFVHNGVAFKVIPVGYVEIFRDEKGLFIEAKKEQLFPQNYSNGAVIDGAAGGLVGALVGATVDAVVASKRNKMTGSEVFIDPLTGHYILPDDFMKK